MRCLTLCQPWATLVTIGAKRIETRSWATRYRGPLAIHAAKGYGKGGMRAYKDLCGTEPFRSVLDTAIKRWLAARGDLRDMVEHPFMPLGAIVAVCELVDCKIIGVPPSGIPEILYEDNLSFVPILGNERAFGDYSAGRFAWLLSDIRALPKPIAARGRLGLWEYAGDMPATHAQMS